MSGAEVRRVRTFVTSSPCEWSAGCTIVPVNHFNVFLYLSLTGNRLKFYTNEIKQHICVTTCKNNSNNNNIKKLQNTAILDTAHVLREVPI